MSAEVYLIKKAQSVEGHIIETLDKVRDGCVSGEFTDVAIIARRGDGTVSTAYSTHNYPAIVGGIEYLKNRMIKSWEA